MKFVMGAAIPAKTSAKNRQTNEHLAEPGALTFEPSALSPVSAQRFRRCEQNCIHTHLGNDPVQYPPQRLRSYGPDGAFRTDVGLVRLRGTQVSHEFKDLSEALVVKHDTDERTVNVYATAVVFNEAQVPEPI